jgi:hypothetical protein
MIYYYELQKLGLPCEGLSQNGEVLTNKWERLDYLNNLDDDAKHIFMNLIYEIAYNQGFYDGCLEQEEE